MNDSLDNLHKQIVEDPALNVKLTEGGECLFIGPKSELYDEGVQYIQQIYEWLKHGEYPNLRVVNVFTRYDLNTLKVCRRDEYDHQYDTLIDCFNDTDRTKPYED